MLDPKALLAYCEAELDALTDCLRQAVEIESPSQNPVAIDRMANYFAREFSHGSLPLFDFSQFASRMQQTTP